MIFGFVNGVGCFSSTFREVVTSCVPFCCSIASIFSREFTALFPPVVFIIESFGISSIVVGIVLGVACVSNGGVVLLIETSSS